nr:cation diffusion facilitator family transporter [Paenactinomyces guangxiensis]
MPRPKQDGAQKGAWLSIISYAILSLIKCWTGVAAHSQVVFADGLNNLSDILLSVAILIGLKVAVQPADQNHPFGHSKAETVATLIAASFMVLVSLNIWLDAAQTLWKGGEKTIHPIALYVSLGSAFIMYMVSLINFRLSRKTESQALEASAHDNRSDALVSLGAAVGIFAADRGFAWIDPVAAFVVGILILRTGWGIGRPAIDSLMDGFDQNKLSGIEEQVLNIDGIRQVKELRARNHGPYVFVEVTVGVDEHLSVGESHSLTEKIEQRLIGYENIEHVHVHVEPKSLTPVGCTPD